MTRFSTAEIEHSRLNEISEKTRVRREESECERTRGQTDWTQFNSQCDKDHGFTKEGEH